MKLMYKIAVMGDRDSIYGFAAVGLEPFPIVDAVDASKKLHDLVESGEYAVIYITEALADNLEREITYYSSRKLPSIILIPGVAGNTGKGMTQVKKSVERAVGSDIIFGG